METYSKTESTSFVLVDAGLSDYEAAYDLQNELVAKRKSEAVTYDYLVLVEHPDVYTYGRRNPTPPPSHVRPVFAVERGGEITFHNPGQLVSYPILKLRAGEQDLHLHLRRLESVLIGVLQDFGLEGERREGATGVWLVDKNKKIASIGIAVTGWVTYHGAALNVSNDLSGFNQISPCGFPSEVMTSMREQLNDSCPPMSEVKESFVRHFSVEFERQLLS